MRTYAMIGGVAAMLAGSVAAGAAASTSAPTEPAYGEPDRHKSSGKHKPRRHGQKLKSCRVKIGRRARRKHRRAA